MKAEFYKTSGSFIAHKDSRYTPTREQQRLAEARRPTDRAFLYATGKATGRHIKHS